jgi:hypothetical protein
VWENVMRLDAKPKRPAASLSDAVDETRTGGKSSVARRETIESLGGERGAGLRAASAAALRQAFRLEILAHLFEAEYYK